MIFEINHKRLVPYESSWNPTENEIEGYLFDEDPATNPRFQEVFGEELLLIKRQPRTGQGKRADIVGVDQGGDGVVIEFKRDEGRLGVETQALHYLADVAPWKGVAFLAHLHRNDLREQVEGFLEGEIGIEKLNRFTRIILLARRFDPALFAMGEWLSTMGVAFRCISYTPFKVKGRRFLSFSVEFDRSRQPVYPLVFPDSRPRPGYYWHNIGEATDEWWSFLKKFGQIPASWQNEPGDKGERLLRRYVKGDIVFAYASHCGAIGWGEVKREDGYKLVPKGSREDMLGWNRHRLEVIWKAVAPKIEDGIRPATVEEDFGIYHPVGTRASIEPEKAKHLREELTSLFGAAPGPLRD